MNAALRGKTIAFSGTFSDLKRREVISKAQAAGAIVNAGVSKNIDILFTGDSNVGIKKVHAKALGIQVIPATSFLKYINGRGSNNNATAMIAAKKPSGRPVSRVEAFEEEDYTPKAKRRAAMVDDFEAEYENDASTDDALMPWEVESAAPAKRRTTMKEVDFEEEEDYTPARKAARAPVRRVQAEDFEEEEESGLMPWETEAPMKAARRVAAPAKRSAMMEEDVEEDFEVEASEGAMPWDVEADVPARGRVPATRPTTTTAKSSASRIRQQQQVEDMDFDAIVDEDIEADGASSPWDAEDDTPIVSRSARREAIERPVRQSRTAMVAKSATVPSKPTAPFWNLSDKNIAFAGSFDAITKTQGIVMATRNGAEVLSGLNADIDILVCGQGSEAKRMAAKKKGIKTIAESTFIAACRN